MFLVDCEKTLVDESTKNNQASRKYNRNSSTKRAARNYDVPLSISEIRAAKQFQEEMYLLSGGKLKPTIEGFVEHVRKHSHSNN